MREKNGITIDKPLLEIFPATPYYARRLEEYQKQSQIVIVGAGRFGRRLYETLDDEGAATRICCACDNNRNGGLQLQRVLPVLSVETAVKTYPDAYYIITPREYENELLQQLAGLGIPVKNISIFTFAYTGLIDY